MLNSQSKYKKGRVTLAQKYQIDGGEVASRGTSKDDEG
jgi:hypothetical protein